MVFGPHGVLLRCLFVNWIILLSAYFLDRAWLVASMRNDHIVLGLPELSFQCLLLQPKRHVFLRVRRLVIIRIAIRHQCSPKLLKRIARMSTKRDVRKDSLAEGTCPIGGPYKMIDLEFRMLPSSNKLVSL